MCRWLAAAVAVLILWPTVAPGAEFPLRDGQRVVFLGDSITQAGTYIQDIETYLVTRFPDRKVEIINLGLSSETVSGLSEPGHPFPRPDVRQRLDRALELTRPNLVILCYGMNDGIYYPESAERTTAYRVGIEEVVGRVQKAGVQIILGTPPPFDPRPVGSKLRPISADVFGYQHPFDGYDGVLAGFGDWLISRRAQGWSVVDVHGEVARFVSLIRESDPEFTVAPDGVHPDATGHWLMAQAYLKAWDAPQDVEIAMIDARTLQGGVGEVDQIARNGEAIDFAWTTRISMPHDPKWDARLIDKGQVDSRFNRHRLVVQGLERQRYTIFEGEKKVGEATREQLAEGLDLLTLPDLSTNRRSAELRTLVVDRQRALGSSWLQEVGHGPPVYSRTTPLEEARKRSESADERIRALARPIPIRFRLVPLGR